MFLGELVIKKGELVMFLGRGVLVEYPPWFEGIFLLERVGFGTIL
jgi:hypothetical protein